MPFNEVNSYYLGQGIGIFAFLIGLTVFIQRDDKKLKIRLIIYTAFMGLHFFLLGATPAGISASLNAVRTLVSIYFRKSVIMYIFITLTLTLTLPNIHHSMEYLPVVATIMSTVAFFKFSQLKLRITMWLSTVCWVIYNFWIGTLGGMLIESSFLLINGIAIYRFTILRKKGIDPFARQK